MSKLNIGHARMGLPWDNGVSCLMKDYKCMRIYRATDNHFLNGHFILDIYITLYHEFWKDKDLKEAATSGLQSLVVDKYNSKIQKIVSRYDKCSNKDGNYVEKENK